MAWEKFPTYVYSQRASPIGANATIYPSMYYSDDDTAL